MITIYFTATGNCLHVARQIGGELLSLPKLMRNGTPALQDEAIGLVFPCYGFDLPRMVRRFIESAHIQTAYFFAVMVYGKRTQGGLSQLKRAAAEARIPLDYTNEYLMVDNFLPLFEMNEERSRPKDTPERLQSIVLDIHTRKRFHADGMERSIIVPKCDLIRQELGDHIDDTFTVSDQCILCGTCARVCPTGNIRLEKRPVYLHNCEYCQACIHACPVAAIHVAGEQSSARYRHPQVRLADILDANSTGS
ncbi:MAG: EFR1 family ferrodoxin [Candidatus Pelethousia sp.]|nr:EFR1 family ferrodoxin [Candidatus Pelethousia sp.]